MYWFDKSPYSWTFNIVIAMRATSTAWNVSVFGVFLVRIFPHSNWIQRNTPNMDTFHTVQSSQIWLTLRKFCQNTVFFWPYNDIRENVDQRKPIIYNIWISAINSSQESHQNILQKWNVYPKFILTLLRNALQTVRKFCKRN